MPVVPCAASRRRQRAVTRAASCSRSTARTSGIRTRRCPAAPSRSSWSRRAGVRLRLAEPVDGQRELVDGMSSWWSAIHGYRHPVLDEAARDQLGRMSHVMFGGLTHEPAVRLARRAGRDHPGAAAARLPRRLGLGVGRGRGQDVPPVLALAGARPAAAPADLARRLPRRHLQPDVGVRPRGRHAPPVDRACCPRQVFADAPPAGFDAPADPAYVGAPGRAGRRARRRAGRGRSWSRWCRARAGCASTPRRYLRVLRESATRTTCCWCSTRSPPASGARARCSPPSTPGVSPDVMCVGKALTGGYLTMAAALCTHRVADGISRGEVPGAGPRPDLHGQPARGRRWPAPRSTCCSGRTGAREVERIEAGLREGLAPARDAAGVRDVRVLGAIGVVQLDHEVDMARRDAAAAVRARRVAAAVPRPRLHDAAVRDRRRGRGRRSPRGRRRRPARRALA